MVSHGLLACAYAALCWWLGTGIILWLVRRPAKTFPWSLGGWSLLLACSFWGVAQSMKAVSVFHAYLAFGSVILMWGWHELAFLTGWVTGRRKLPLSPGVRGWQRFRQSLDVVIYHEIGLILNFALLWLIQDELPNHVALCTFALLWFLRVSAKLNLFFGVPQSGAQYLPQRLAYLASYFPVRGLTPWFVLSFSFGVGMWLWLVWQAQSGHVAVSSGWVLLACLLGLGMFEHAMMMLPWPLETLWGWALKSKPAETPDSHKRGLQ